MEFMPGKPLPEEMLYRRCDPDQFSFETTADLEKLSEIPGQERATEAIHFATEIEVDGHNVFVLGPAGSGRHRFVQQFLEKKAAARVVPPDLCYVYNFDDARKPRALVLPPGRSKELRDDVESVIEDAQTAIPAAFESEEFQAQREAVAEEFKDEQESAFRKVEAEAADRGIGVIQTPGGIAFVPLRDGEALDTDEFKKLPGEEQKKIHEDIENLTRRLQQLMRAVPKKAREMRQKVRSLEHEVANLAVTGLVDELIQKYQDIGAVVEYLKKMLVDIVENVNMFLRPSEGPGAQGMPAQMQQMQQMMESKGANPKRRYAINVLVDQTDAKGAPVICEDKPSFVELIGRIEYESEFGSLMTNYTLIRSGSLHRANGGYLVIDAAKLFSFPMAWDGLKRALKSRELRVRSLADDVGLISTVTLEPEPIALDVKVVLVGERIYYYLLQRHDPEFAELFKIEADFEDQIVRNDDNLNRLARWTATIIREQKLKHMDRSGLARLMEQSARRAGDTERYSADIRYATDLVREAHYWAGERDKDLIGAEDIQKAIDSQVRRASRYRDRLQEEMLRDTLVVETTGSRVGQINGLAVFQLGDFAFGRPQRITATVTLGSGEVVDIEREVELGGPIHSKGVLILAGFLRSHYVTDRPLSLAASLVFEQSYGGVDGDSASAAELCALASALAKVPIRQSFAITGSVDQQGRVQAIGSVNEKVEGFFDVCEKRGLTGEQGVLIPVANVKHLMLRQDVRQAVNAEKFRVYAVDHVDRCLEILTGLPAGERTKEGEFPEGSMNRRISDRLLSFAEQRRAYAAPARPEGRQDNDESDA